jgi:hypothetical protein
MVFLKSDWTKILKEGWSKYQDVVRKFYLNLTVKLRVIHDRVKLDNM